MTHRNPGNPGDAEPTPEFIGEEIVFEAFQADPVAALQQGNVIVGIEGSAKINLFEKTVAGLVALETILVADIELRARYLSDPLSTQLQPRQFHGSLRNGTALVSSASPGRPCWHGSAAAR